jgi:hypothetical protein
MAISPGDTEDLTLAVVRHVWTMADVDAAHAAAADVEVARREAADAAVRGWAERSREVFEVEVQVASALDVQAQARRLLLSDAAARKLKERVCAAVRRGQDLEVAVEAALDDWNRQLLRRQVAALINTDSDVRR